MFHDWIEWAAILGIFFVCTLLIRAKPEFLAYSFYGLKQHCYASLTRFFDFTIVGGVLMVVQNDLATENDMHLMVLRDWLCLMYSRNNRKDMQSFLLYSPYVYRDGNNHEISILAPETITQISLMSFYVDIHTIMVVVIKQFLLHDNVVKDNLSPFYVVLWTRLGWSFLLCHKSLWQTATCIR